MFKTIDIDIDYNLLLNEFYSLDIDTLLNKTSVNQISLHCRENTPLDKQLSEGCGSLYYDWEEYDKNPGGDLPLRNPILQEEDFTVLSNLFVGTYFETVIKHIAEAGYHAYRGRFMKSLHKTCLTIHKDLTPRLHIPIYTNENCVMIVDDKVIRLPFGQTYVVDTRLPHTAINASKNSRVHLVFCVDKF